jgi:hypothetical protein
MGSQYEVADVIKEPECMFVDTWKLVCREHGLLLTEFARILT